MLELVRSFRVLAKINRDERIRNDIHYKIITIIIVKTFQPEFSIKLILVNIDKTKVVMKMVFLFKFL